MLNVSLMKPGASALYIYKRFTFQKLQNMYNPFKRGLVLKVYKDVIIDIFSLYY